MTLRRRPEELVIEAHVSGLTRREPLDALPWTVIDDGETVAVQAVIREDEHDAFGARVAEAVRGTGASVMLYWTWREVGSDRRPEVF